MRRSNLVAVSLFATLLGGQVGAQVGPATADPYEKRRPFKIPVGLIADDVAGRSLGEYPGFTFLQSFYEGTPVEATIDFSRHPEVAPGSYGLWVVAHRTPKQWGIDPVLVDARGSSQTVEWSSSTVAANAVVIDSGLLSGDAGLGFGVGYDVVLDVDGDGRLGSGDLIDGFGEEAGFYVVRDPKSNGPLATVETEVFVTNVKAGFEGENIFYPATIATMGELPLIVISHGNGHNYNWYDHLGKHFASWGFIVMSHENDTGPGIETASDTTLTHTDAFLADLATIDGGILVGHVDVDNIVWIGHSRGGEGICRAYDKLWDGTYVPTNYEIDDIRGLSSIAPTIFLSKDDTDPHTVPFHLWTGGADADVDGCGDSVVTQTFLTHERSDLDRFSTYLNGAGHGAFHNGSGSLVASGPCLLNRRATHEVMKTNFLPLVHRFVHGAPAADEFLWRHREEFLPPVPSTDPCIVVNKTFQPRSANRFVIDDYQAERDIATSSSGGMVTFALDLPSEDAMDDPDTNFTYSVDEFMNGMTYSVTGEDSRGFVFGWDSDGEFVEWEITAGNRDFTRFEWLSFRAAQVTRDPITTAALGDLFFDVVLRDEVGNTSRINVGAYGGGVEEPYQRTGCGTGTGWATVFETIRIRLFEFETDGSPLDLSRVEAVRFEFGPSSGTASGRMVVDELELIDE